MSETDVELFDRGEVGEALERFDEDLELGWSRSLGPLNGVYRGRGLAGFEIEELTELADRQVLAVVIARSRGRGSGAGVAATGASRPGPCGAPAGSASRSTRRATKPWRRCPASRCPR